MTSILDHIISYKREEVKQLKKSMDCGIPIALDKQHSDYRRPYPLQHILKSQRNNIIAEIKRKSPSKGHFATIQHPERVAQSYLDAGACAISVLTDTPSFAGSTQDLININNHTNGIYLRKDFIIDPIQILESYCLGAHAVLLIVSVLGDRLASLIDYTRSLGLNAIIEVHDQAELDIALSSNARIIGINNRNLKTFNVDINHSLTLADRCPSHVIKIAESGVQHPDDAHRIFDAGFDGILIGEALSRAPDPKQMINQMRQVS